jgi:hypothetical protein
VPTDVVPTDGATAPPFVTPGIPTGNDGLIVDWQEQPAGLGAVLGVTAAASANGRVVIIGDATEDFLPAIWTSADGTTWQLGDFPDAASNTMGLTGLTAGGPGFVAFGYDYDSDAAISYASTDGVSWQRGDDADLDGQSIYLVGAAGSNVVAFADSGSVFTSTDGLTWTPALDASASDVGDGLLDVASYGGALWAFSTSTAPSEVLAPLDVWRTDDGVAWARLGTVQDSGGALDARAAAGPNGLVVLAEIDRENTFAWMGWQSTDGTTWQAAINSPTEITDILADDLGYIAVGHQIGAGGCAVDETENIGVTWTSLDGLVWRQMPNEGWLGREVEVLGVTGRTLVGVGIDWNQLYSEVVGESGLVWTSALPSEAHDDAPPPEPTPVPTPPGDCG